MKLRQELLVNTESEVMMDWDDACKSNMQLGGVFLLNALFFSWLLQSQRLFCSVVISLTLGGFELFEMWGCAALLRGSFKSEWSWRNVVWLLFFFMHKQVQKHHVWMSESNCCAAVLCVSCNVCACAYMYLCLDCAVWLLSLISPGTSCRRNTGISVALSPNVYQV